MVEILPPPKPIDEINLVDLVAKRQWLRRQLASFHCSCDCCLREGNLMTNELVAIETEFERRKLEQAKRREQGVDKPSVAQRYRQIHARLKEINAKFSTTVFPALATEPDQLAQERRELHRELSKLSPQIALMPPEVLRGS